MRTGIGDDVPVKGLVPPHSGLMWGGPGSKPLSQVTLPEGFKHLPLPCDSQVLHVEETLTEKSLSATEDTEEQNGGGICSTSHSKLAAEPEGSSAPRPVCLCYRIWNTSGSQLLQPGISGGALTSPAQAQPIKSDPLGALAVGVGNL